MDNNTDLAGIIEKLMNDPAAVEMVQKLKQGTLSAESAASTETLSPTDTYGENSSPDTSTLLSSIAPLLKGLNKSAGADPSESKRRNQLLSALKPYLSPERQDLIDTLTSLTGLTGILDLLSGGGKRDNGK